MCERERERGQKVRRNKTIFSGERTKESKCSRPLPQNDDKTSYPKRSTFHSLVSLYTLRSALCTRAKRRCRNTQQRDPQASNPSVTRTKSHLPSAYHPHNSQNSSDQPIRTHMPPQVSYTYRPSLIWGLTAKPGRALCSPPVDHTYETPLQPPSATSAPLALGAWAKSRGISWRNGR